jgi:hypothetical protein
LAELQRERLVLRQRLSYLQRLVRDGDKGVVVVKELRLLSEDDPGHYRFDMVLSQLVPQDLRSEGTARVSVVLSRGGDEQVLALDELPGSHPSSITVDFEHFQVVRGQIVLPTGVVPERLVVDFEPAGPLLSPSSEVFLWSGNPECADVNLTPSVSAGKLSEDLEVE